MKKLGKKTCGQNGTMTAFACDCMTICRANTDCATYCSSTLEASGFYTPYGRLVSTALSGSNFLWGV